MSFSVAPKAAPDAVAGALNGQTPSGAAARERAMARLMGQAPGASAPVAQPSATAVEELAAVTAPEAVKDPVDGQNSTIETPSTDDVTEVAAKPAAPVKAEEPLSSQYAQLARKEKALRVEAQRVKALEAKAAEREADLAAREAAMEGKYVPKERLSKETLRVLQEQGISYEQLTQEMLNAPSPEAAQTQAVINELKAQIEELKQGQEQTKKTFEENQTKAYQQAVNQIRNEAKALVDSDENFEAIKATNSHEDVVELITKTFEDEGRLMTVEEAAKEVEEHLAEEAWKLSQLKKIQKRLNEKAPAAPSVQASGKPADPVSGAAKPAMKTLTNNVGAARQLSAKERAMLAFKGELKS